MEVRLYISLFMDGRIALGYVHTTNSVSRRHEKLSTQHIEPRALAFGLEGSVL